MNGMVRRVAVIVAIAVVCGPSARGEKVMFRDEVTGCEMWRLSDYSTFHEYCHADKPFSRDGRRAVSRWRDGKGIVVFDLADGREVVIGEQQPGTKMSPAFVRGSGRCAVVYNASGSTASVVLAHDLTTGQEREVVKLPPGVTVPSAGVIGPNSEYVLLKGDLNGDGLFDWGLKSLWTGEPPRVVWTSPTAAGYAGTVSPTPDGNRVNFDQQICHPDIIRRANSGEKMTEYTLWTDSTWLGYVAVLDMKTLAATTHLGHGAWRWAHEAWSGDGESLFMHGYAWRAGRDAPSVPIRIVDREEQWSNHYGTCGRSGRYVAGDSGRDGMERLELTDLWTGEVRTVAHVSTPTEPAGRIAQDHGHPAGSPDGTKVIIHSCYDLVNHRLYAVPTQDIRAGDAVIPVETTEGFAAKGKLLIGHGYAGPRMAVSYERTDATHFYGCDWGQDAPLRLEAALKSDVIPKGSRHITDFYGRLFPNGECRPRKEYIAVVKSPDPPRGLAVTRTGQGVRLTWQPPDSHEETAGYVVYGLSGAGPMQRLTPEPVTSCEFVDADGPRDGKFRYLVRAVERCGLYGAPSSVAWVDGAQTGVDLVESYDVRGSAYITPGERPTSDRRSVRVHISAAGDCVLWGRGRAGREAQTLRVAVDGQPLTDVQIEGADWHWVKLAQCRLNAGEHVIEVAAETTYDIRDGNLVTNPSFEDGLQGWTFDGGVTSLDSARSHSGKQSVKLSGHLTGKKLFQVVDLEVKPEWSYRLSFWVRGRFTKSEAQRYHGPHPNTLGRIAALVEPFPYPTGWAVDGNKFDDVEWREVGLMFSSPPQEPGKPTVKRVTVQPFWCPNYWGEQVGTVWIDDVSVTELGPRLRPVKLTKLLVTNVRGYEPKGLDGREAYPFPSAPSVGVTGLRQAGQSRNSVTLAWDATRPGTRGYNVYINAGRQCPATKSFQATSVWGKTSAMLDGLAHSTSYAVSVTAINEDGLEGPPAGLRVATVAGAPETHVLDATRAALTAPMVVQSAAGVSFGVTPADANRPELYDREGVGRQTGTAKFEFTIAEGGRYAVWGRVFAPDGASNSLWFSLDGQPESIWEVPPPVFGRWSWTKPVDGGFWDLKPGKHVISIRTREAGTRLERLVVTNDLDSRQYLSR